MAELQNNEQPPAAHNYLQHDKQLLFIAIWLSNNGANLKRQSLRLRTSGCERTCAGVEVIQVAASQPANALARCRGERRI